MLSLSELSKPSSLECEGLTGVEKRDTNVLQGLGDASICTVPERVDEEKASEASSLAI